MTKVCIECKETHPIYYFYRHPSTGDRRFTRCKKCTIKFNSNSRSVKRRLARKSRESLFGDRV
jgi:hypothetical protein